MSKMRVAQVTRANGTFEIVEREIPEPGAGQVRIKVEACGICHSDAMTKEGWWPGIQYPRVPGIPLLLGRRSILGWPAGSSIDSQDTLSFSLLTGVCAMSEVFPLERAAEAYEHMMSGKARFRAVLTIGNN